MSSKSVTVNNWAGHFMHRFDYSVSPYIMTILKWPVASVQWLPPYLDYSNSMDHGHSKVAGDHIFIY